MKKIININDNCFRRKVDGVNFSSGDLKLSHTLKGNITHEDDIIKKIIYEFPMLLDFKFQKNSSDFILDCTKELGLYFTLKKNNTEFQLLIQFKGFFFIKDDAFLIMQNMIRSLMKIFDTLFRVTLIDIAQDITLGINQILPCPDIENDDYKYNFNNRLIKHTTNNNKEVLYTGFELISGRYKLKLYDKKAEVHKCKNKIKKDYYNSIFNKYEKSEITRVELSVKHEACEIFYENVLKNSSEDDFCSAITGLYNVSTIFK